MKIWLVSLFDPTPLDEPIFPRFIGIAEAGGKKGHHVTHFTSTFRHTTKNQRFSDTHIHKENENYDVLFIRSMGYKHNMLPKRFIAHWQFARKLIKQFDKMPKPDAIFISMPPLSTVQQVSRWGRKNGVPVVIDIIDPWPDAFIKDVPVRLKKIVKLFMGSFYRKLRKSFENSSAITAISNGYLDWASKYHDPGKVTGCFYLAIDYQAVKREYEMLAIGEGEKDSSKLRLIYAGSLASSYDIPSIIEAARVLDKKYPNKTEFIITGKGPQAPIVIQAEKELSNLKYLGFVSKETLLRQYHIADLGLIQHKNSLTQTITYKFFNYLSAELVLINSLQTEMAKLIDDEKLGLNNLEEDVPQLVSNIEQFIDAPSLLDDYKSNIAAFVDTKGDSTVVYGNLITFIERVVHKS